MSQKFISFRTGFLKAVFCAFFGLLLPLFGHANISCQSLLSQNETAVYPDKAELRKLFATRDSLTDAQARKFEESVLLPKFMGLAKRWAFEKAIKYSQIPREDLEQSAMLGLVEAIRSYKHDSEYMFSTVAYPLVHDRMSETVGALYPGAAKVHNFYLVTRVVRLKIELQEKLKRRPTLEEVAQENEKRGYAPMSPVQVQDLLHWNDFVRNIETKITVEKSADGGFESYTFDSLELAKSQEMSVEDQVLIREFENNLIQKMLVAFKPTTKQTRDDRLEILLNYLGLEITQEKNGRYHFVFSKSWTMTEIASEKNLSISAIQNHIKKCRQIIIRSLTDMDSKIYFDQLFEIYSEE